MRSLRRLLMLKIAVFLDVDKTLTRERIQCVMARELGCPQAYAALEEDLQASRIDSREFGQKLIALFAEKGFNKQQALTLAARGAVELQPSAQQILRMPDVDIFLVSSGPNYYIEWLARQYNIPPQNVCCSKYRFSDADGRIAACDEPIDEVQKQTFVQERAARYDISIGIGDSERFDGFVTACTVGLLTERENKTDNRIYVPHLALAVDLLNRLKGVQRRTASFGRLAAFVLGMAAATGGFYVIERTVPTDSMAWLIAGIKGLVVAFGLLVLWPLVQAVAGSAVYDRWFARRRATP